VAKGITINGLVILSNEPHGHTDPPGGLEQYYRRNVIGGVGAFVVVSVGFESFVDALIKKLTTEIAAQGTRVTLENGEHPRLAKYGASSRHDDSQVVYSSHEF
jgi:hypothetical protein